MFYSHEILTSRKHGVATIWLVATLGSKSTLKKVNRKDINEVNVPRACEIIVSPEMPMALRLQSHLLYGVSRVYYQQCSYVLTDAQAAQQSMIQAFKQMSNNVLDPDAGKIRPELLLIPDDPAFVPDLAFGVPVLTPELPDLEFTQSTLSSQNSSLHRSPGSSEPSSYAAGAGIQIPASDSEIPGFGRFSNLPLGIDTSTANRSRSTLGNILDEFYNDLHFSPTADFGFDAEGNLYDLDSQGAAIPNQDGNSLPRRNFSDAAAEEQARREHEHARQIAEQSNEYAFDNQDLPQMGEQDDMQQDFEPFPPRARSELRAEDEELLDPDYQPHPEEEAMAEDGSQEVAAAPLASRTRARKLVLADTNTQIRTSTFNEWNRNYVQNMLKASAQKSQKSATALAKRNAEYWVWKSGIGSVRSETLIPEADDPFCWFAGDSLLARLKGTDKDQSSKKKRSRSEFDADQAEDENRVHRRRSQSPVEADVEGVRGEQKMAEPEAVGSGLAPIEDEDIEIGREAPTPLPGDPSQDLSALMPWNLSVSRHSSNRQTIRPFTSAGGSVGSGVSLLTGQAQGRQRKGGRLTSASPLMGRGVDDTGAFPGGESSSAYGDDALGLGVAGSDEGLDMPGGEAQGLSGTVGGWDVVGAGAAGSQLDRDSRNFLEFVRTSWAAEQPAGESDDEQVEGQAAEGSPGVLFEKLLPPDENSNIVAAQGLLHVLTLSTKGLLTVVQEEAFGEIWLWPVE